jgi:hypothetical protein
MPNFNTVSSPSSITLDPKDPNVIVPKDKHAIALVRELVQRGEAALPAPDGSLAPGVTHLIVGKTEEGYPILKRVRFSAF